MALHCQFVNEVIVAALYGKNRLNQAVVIAETWYKFSAQRYMHSTGLYVLNALVKSILSVH